LLAHGRWLSSGTPVSSTTKTGCHDIAEILLKVALNTKNQIKKNQIRCFFSSINDLQPLQLSIQDKHLYSILIQPCNPSLSEPLLICFNYMFKNKNLKMANQKIGKSNNLKINTGL